MADQTIPLVSVLKVAGNGAAGGSGGSVTLAADGAIRALSTGVEVRSAGGAGGIGANSLDYH